MKISFVEIQKIIELLKSKDETNRQLGTMMLENFGILKEFQDDIIVYLAQIPNFKKQRKHKILENITKSTFNFQTNSHATLYTFSKLLPHYNGNLSDLMKLSFRTTGNPWILNEGDLLDALDAAKFWIEIFEKQGVGFDLLHFGKLTNYQYIDTSRLTQVISEEFPFEYELKNYFHIINIVDFPLTKLNEKILKRLKRKTLQMRYGYFIRHEKLLQKYPSINIKINESDSFRRAMIKSPYHNKVLLMTWLDRGIFQGKYLTAVINSHMRFFPRDFPKELNLYPNLQVVYFLDFKLKKLPHSILICNSLEYLIISTAKDRIKISPQLVSHPNLKGVFIEHKTNFHDRVERKDFFYLSIKDFLSLDNYTFDLTNNDLRAPLSQIEETLIIESQKFAQKFKEYRTYKEDVFSNYHFDIPIPLFEDVIIENKLMSKEQIERIMVQLESNEFAISNVQNSLQSYNQLITPKRSHTSKILATTQKSETKVELTSVDTDEDDFLRKLTKLLIYLFILGVLLNLKNILEIIL